MSHSHSRHLAILGALLSLLAATPSWAWHISGQVFCDVNGSQAIDAGDTPINGVGVLITALTVAPGGTFPGTTGSGNGSYTVALPDHEDDYKVALTGSGLPAGANVIVPSSGAYGVPSIPALHLANNAFDATANFLVDGCVATPTPTATPSPSPTPTASATPTTTASDVPTPTATTTPTVTTTPTQTATPVLTPTPVVTATPAGVLTDFHCYEVDRSTIGPITGLDLVDRFGSAIVDLAAGKRVKRLCNPAFVNSESTSAPTIPDHLVGYVISQRMPRFAPITGQTVANQFGTVVLTIVRPILLLVPSAKSLVGPTPAIDPAIDHFQCYAVKGGKMRVSGLTVVDQFGTLTIDLKRPTRLCTAVDKRGEGILDANANLLCYNVRPPKNTPVFRGPPGSVFVANQFGPDTLVVNHARELCVRSSVNQD
jgi:hypothetical protein